MKKKNLPVERLEHYWRLRFICSKCGHCNLIAEGSDYKCDIKPLGKVYECKGCNRKVLIGRKTE
jgi:hypothetical protein